MADEWTTKLEAYADGELSDEDLRAADSHIRACPSCAADLANHLLLRQETKAAALRRYAPSPEFRRRMQDKLTSRPHSAWLAWATAAALAVVLFAAVMLNYRQRQEHDQLRTFSEVADLHVATLASSNPVDVVSSDRHTVKPWFQGKLPFSFNLPTLDNTEFSLVGGRLAYLGQAPGAELIYMVRKHQISVFIFQDRLMNRLPDMTKPEGRLSFTTETWSAGELRYFVIGDASQEDIRRLADLLRSAAQS